MLRATFRSGLPQRSLQTIGTGNIVGCCYGPSVANQVPFLTWLTGVFGIATKYSETYISMKYRVNDAMAECSAVMWAWRGSSTRDGQALLCCLPCSPPSLPWHRRFGSVELLAGALYFFKFDSRCLRNSHVVYWHCGYRLVAIVSPGGLKKVSGVREAGSPSWLSSTLLLPSDHVA